MKASDDCCGLINCRCSVLMGVSSHRANQVSPSRAVRHRASPSPATLPCRTDSGRSWSWSQLLRPSDMLGSQDRAVFERGGNGLVITL
jgi:hypothetical protein